MKRVAFAVAVLACAGSASAQSYRFPIELPSSGTPPYVTAYRDQDTGTGLQDWNCGTTTYNGHKGSDFGIGSWPVMDAGSRWIVAAADGKVIFVNDGCDDHCSTGACGCGSGFGNYVRLQHADGKTTTYGHMMTGSIVVSLNADVKCGQHLGKVGSSGNSTGPHLHFEPRNSSATSLEPFSGPCGASSSLWLSQGTYKGLPGDQCENPTPPEVDDSSLASESPTGSIDVAPGASFQKSWVLQNTGNTTWSASGGYTLAHTGGDALGGSFPASLGGGESIAPNAQKTWAVAFVAPTAPGSYSGTFRMDRAGKGAFGATLHLDVVVKDPGGGGGASGGGGESGAAGSPPSGGAGPSGGGSVSAGGKGGTPAAGGAGANAATASGTDVQGGCACRAAPVSESRLGWLALAALALLRRRR